MVGFLINRLLHAVAVLFGVVSVTFALLHVAGDPLAGLIPPGAAPEVESQIRVAYGLDRPLAEQYLDFVGRAMRGDFGDSWRQGRPALGAVLERLPATLWLTVVATTLAVATGSSLGVISAARPGSVWDIVARMTALLGQAVPAFWLGTMLILLFAVDLQWLPSSGLEGPGGVILPALSLAAFPAATLTRLLRASMIETLGADYIRTARAKGLSRSRILIGHALRNAALPALAFTGLQVGFLLGGAVIVEGVFAYPGIGGLALDAVAARDIPLVEAFVWVVAVMILVVNILTGALTAVLDPRLREDGLALGSAAS
ncbi:MAG: binding-protein-dependent transport system inner rane component [Thermomicrobiales bacterium]|nr:binding-protein-dependent transport system inner rane component [Thermomicrobiales bacterium]